MKKLATVFVFIFSWLLMPSLAEAQIWIVNNNFDGAGGYDNAQDAHDAASAGDTLYLVPSEFEYELDLSKELHLFGSGYLLEENEIQGDPKISELSINIVSGGENSTLSSLYVASDVFVNGVKFDKCYITSVGGGGGASNMTIIRSYLVNDTKSRLSNSFIANTFIDGRLWDINASTIINNVITNNVNSTNEVENSVIENNIFISSTSSDHADIFNIENDNIVNNNIFASPEPGNPGTVNQFDVDPSTLFIGPDGNSKDGQWQLSDSSPAKGAGTNGDDIGMYGGANPYQLSGLPDIPRITAFTAPATGSSNTGLPVSITIESNN
jgi:hypothetical protein